MRIPVEHIQPGDTDRFNWEGRPVLVRRRCDAELARLAPVDERLRDATSASSDQPVWARNRYRSREPEWFVAIALATDLGCSVDSLPAAADAFPGTPWTGGFEESCHHSRYDLAGRVFTGQDARRNLPVPPYRFEGDTLVLGGLR